jgi:flavin reductase (DIM6/NTAB) family NADH-FMN oxidoreductase RutF
VWEVADIAAADTAVVVVTAVVAAAADDDDDDVVDKDRNVHKMRSEEVEGLSLP